MWFLSQVYLQPTNEVLERAFADPNCKEFSARNVVPRVVSRSVSVVMATIIAAMLPFFGDINSVIGAFGFMPLDFILPVVFYNLTFKPSKRSPIFWLNVTIAVVFSALGVIAAVAAVRQLSLDAKTYRLFANVWSGDRYSSLARLMHQTNAYHSHLTSRPKQSFNENAERNKIFDWMKVKEKIDPSFDYQCINNTLFVNIQTS